MNSRWNAWRRVRATVLTCSIICGSGACDTIDVRNTDQQAIVEFSDTVVVTTSTKLTVDGINGTIVVTGDAPTGMIQISGARRVRSETEADARERLADIRVTIEEVGDVVTVRTEHLREPNGRSYEVDYTIFVPPTFAVEIANTNGIVSLARLEAPTRVNITNGTIQTEDVSGDLYARISNGTVDADASLQPGGSIDLATVNGEISLTIPTNTSATFSATIVNGTIELDNLNLNEQRITASAVTGQLGDGNGTVTLRVTNGGIRAIGS